MWKYLGVSISVVLLCVFCAGSAAAQGRVIPFTLMEIECSEVPGEEVEGEDVTQSRGQMDTARWFSAEPVLNGQIQNVLDWNYYPTPDVELYEGEQIFTRDGVAGTFEVSFSGYWNADGGNFSAAGLGTGELAGMQMTYSGGGLDFDSAMSIVKDDPRVVDGNPCHPGPMPSHGEASFIYGQIVDLRPPHVIAADLEQAANRDLARRYLDAWEVADLETLDEMFAEDFVNHSDPLPPDREGMMEFAADHRSDVPDGDYTIHQLVVEGDKVFIFGHFQGPDEESSFYWSTLIRIEDGQIAERWGS